MPFNEELPEWKKDNPDERPAQSKLDAGFVPMEKPPASMWNWFANRTYRALKQLFENAIHKEEKGVPNGVAKLGADGKLAPGQENTVTIKDASLIEKGIVMLSNLLNGTSEAKAATEKALGTHVGTGATTAQAGHVQLSNSTTGTSETKAATEKAVKDAKDSRLPLTGGTIQGQLIVNEGLRVPNNVGIHGTKTDGGSKIMAHVDGSNNVRLGDGTPLLTMTGQRILDDSMRDAANGFAGLGADGKLASTLLPIGLSYQKLSEYNFAINPTSSFSFGGLGAYKDMLLRFTNVKRTGSGGGSGGGSGLYAKINDAVAIGYYFRTKWTGINGTASPANELDFAQYQAQGTMYEETLSGDFYFYNRGGLVTFNSVILGRYLGSLANVYRLDGMTNPVIGDANKIDIRADNSGVLNSGTVELWGVPK